MALIAAAMLPLPAAVRDLRYSESSVVDIFGTVENMREVAAGASLPGIHLVIRKDKHGVVDVYLGPSDYVAGFALHFRPGDIVEAVGSKVKTDSGDVVLAREVRRNDSTMYLRDEHGSPLWPR